MSQEPLIPPAEPTEPGAAVPQDATQDAAPAPGSWEAIANEIAPLNAPLRGLATGSRRGKNPRYPGLSAGDPARTDGRPDSFARPRNLHVVPMPFARGDAPFEDAIPGRIVASPRDGDFYLCTRAASEVHRSFANIPSRLECAIKTERFPGLSGVSIDEMLFVDIETMGLSSDGPLFLIGILHFDGGNDGCLEQLLARDTEEEKAVLAYFSRISRGRTLVTFNGRSFDWPYIRGRTLHHSLKVGAPGHHFDLLQHARRTWRDLVPNCRLQTLEFHLCGREREDDVPSAQVPEEYERFMEVRKLTGQGAAIMAPVLHHNALDVLTMAELLCLACDQGR